MLKIYTKILTVGMYWYKQPISFDWKVGEVIKNNVNELTFRELCSVETIKINDTFVNENVFIKINM